MITIHTAGYQGKIRGVTVNQVSGKYFVGPLSNGSWAIYKGENGYPQVDQILEIVAKFKLAEFAVARLEKA